MVYEHKNLYPKSTYYSELFKEEIDDTKSTDIYRMELYKHYLLFTEVADRIVAYDFEQGKIVHFFEGSSDAIFDLAVYQDQLISLSCDGVLYVWDLKVLK
jgi:WD40 repeat protein